MSMETAQWLNGGNILVGYGQTPWWADDALLANLDESPLYQGPIPLDDVKRRLFNFRAKSFLTAHLRPVPHNYKGETIEVEGQRYRLVIDPDGRQTVGPNDADDVFGIFSDGYDVHNHQFVDVLLEQTAAILDDTLGIESAGLLQNRAVGWVSVSIPATATTKSGIELRPRLLSATSFNGKFATGHDRVATLTVCDNTLAMARAEGAASGDRVRVRHTKNSKMRLANAREALRIVFDMQTTLTKELDALAAKKVTTAQWQKVLDAMVPLPEEVGKGLTLAETKRNELTMLYTEDARVTPWKGTQFGVLQAFNTYRQHVQAVRGQTHRAERNLLNVLDGSEADEDMKVLSVLQSVAA